MNQPFLGLIPMVSVMIIDLNMVSIKNSKTLYLVIS